MGRCWSVTRCLVYSLIPLILIISTACNGLPSTVQGDEPNRRDTQKPPDTKNCPGVESAVIQILQAENPIGAAERKGYSTRDGKIQVLLVLAADDPSFLDTWGVEVGSGAGGQVQVFARPELICEIARHRNVLAVRLPQLGIPQ